MKFSLKQLVVAILVLAISVGLVEKLVDMDEQVNTLQVAVHVIDSEEPHEIATDFIDQALLADYQMPPLLLVAVMLSLMALAYSPPYPRPILRPPLSA